jgi:hypothetical protein
VAIAAGLPIMTRSSAGVTQRDVTSTPSLFFSLLQRLKDSWPGGHCGEQWASRRLPLEFLYLCGRTTPARPPLTRHRLGDALESAIMDSIKGAKILAERLEYVPELPQVECPADKEGGIPLWQWVTPQDAEAQSTAG